MHLTLVAIATPEPRRGRLCCPVCQDPRVVPDGITCTSLLGQRQALVVDRQGLHLDPQAVPTEAGSLIAIAWRCGAGHRFSLRLRTIYEATTAETVVLPETIADAQDDRG